MKEPKILLAGVGYMGKEYYKVLRDMRCLTTVVGNSASGTQQFVADTDGAAYPGGINAYLANRISYLSSYRPMLFPLFYQIILTLRREIITIKPWQQQ